MRTALFLMIVWLGCLSTALAQTTATYGATAGYRDLDLSGNRSVYRSQVNEETGMDLQGLWFNLSDTKDETSWFDRVRLDAAGFGGSPHGRVSLDLAEGPTYRIHLNYQRLAHYSFLPEVIGTQPDEWVARQHSLDQRNQLLDFRLELRPTARLRPLVGYSWGTFRGPSQTTFSVGGDEFQLDSQVDETQREVYAGLAFDTARWTGELVTGQRRYVGREAHLLTPGSEAGNSAGTLFGQQIALEELERQDRVETETPATRLHTTGRFNDKARLVASYAVSDGETESSSDESLAGNLVSVRVRRIFGSRTEQVEGRTEQPSWQGQARFEAEPNSHLSLISSVSRSHRELDGLALIETLFTDATTLGGAPAADLETTLASEPHWRRDDTVFQTEATAMATSVFGFKVLGGTQRRQTAIDVDPAQIVIPGGQDGTYQRKINRYGAGLLLRLKNLKVDLDWRDEEADRAIMRTDYLNRDVLQLKVDYKPWKILRLSGRYKDSDHGNDTEHIAYQGADEQTQVGADLIMKNLTFHVGYGEYELATSAIIRNPTDFSYVTTQHREDGSSQEASLDWTFLKRYTLSGSYSLYENEGALPFDLESYLIHAEVSLTKQLQLFVEGGTRDYAEISLPLSDYQAETYGLYLRWMP